MDFLGSLRHVIKIIFCRVWHFTLEIVTAKQIYLWHKIFYGYPEATPAFMNEWVITLGEILLVPCSGDIMFGLEVCLNIFTYHIPFKIISDNCFAREYKNEFWRLACNMRYCRNISSFIAFTFSHLFTFTHSK